MAEGDAVLDRHLRPRVVVVGDAVHGRARGASRPTSTIGTSRLALQDHVVVEHGAAEDDAVGAELEQRLHRVRPRGAAARLPVFTSTL